MAFLNLKINSQQSPIGTNSDNVISGSNWSADTYTGQGELLNFEYVVVSLQTDEAGTLFFDFSVDGVNYSTFPVAGFLVASGIHEYQTAHKGSFRYFRARFVGTGGRSYFRLYTSYTDSEVILNSPLSQDINIDQPANTVKAVLHGADSAGNYQRVSVNQGNALLTSSFYTEVALGNIDNYQIGTKFGRNPSIDVGSAPEDMWNGGGLYTGQPIGFTPETVSIFSSSAADTAAGTGARTIQITGLKTAISTEYETEDITLNGTTSVDSVESWWRVVRVRVLTGGSTGENEGDITVRSTTTTSNVFCVMTAGFNQSTLGAYTVPFGKTMVVRRIRKSIIRSNGSAGSATLSFRVRPPGGVFNAARVFEVQTGGSENNHMEGGLVVSAGSDVRFRIDSVSDNGTVADCEFEYVLINDI